MPVTSPIRFKLRTALFIAGAFSIFLTCYFAVSYISIKESLTSRSDREVTEQVDSILFSMDSPGDVRNFSRIAYAFNSTGEAMIGLKLVRFENPSRTIQTLGPARLTALLDSHTFMVRQLPLSIRVGNNTIRVFARSNKFFTIFAAINTVAFEEVYDDMLRTYLILLFTGILAAFLIGMFTAGLALRPLKILLSSARSIKDETAGKLHQLPTDTSTLEINELATVINDILAARDRNIAALHDFTADAAHELRTPLTILKGEMEVDLRVKDLSSDEKQAVLSNLEEVQRLIQIVEGLLMLARAEQESNSVPESPEEPWRIGEFLNTVIVRLRQLADAKGIQIQLTLDADVSLSLPQPEVERIVENILLNAIQYSADGKVVEVRAERSQIGELVVSITDQGTGLSSEELTHIFDRFWRADISRSRSLGGTGLGLTIAKKLADRMHIKLETTSKIAEGTMMKCIFPATVLSE
ncbi:MAG: ATP-binding protein [Ignavibacteriota bacterium]